MAPPSSRRHSSSAISFLLSAIAGAAFALCHQEDSHAWLACLAWAPFFLIFDRPRPFFFAWFGGFIGWLGALPWVAHTVHTYGALPSWLAALIWTLLCAALALEHGFLAWTTVRFTDPGSVRRICWVAAVWILMEVQRGFFVGGFPWNLAAYSWVDLPGALELSAWVGAPGLSFLVVLTGGLVALLIPSRLQKPGANESRFSRHTTAAAGLSSVALLLILAGRTAPNLEDPDLPSFPVRVIQPNASIAYERETLMESYERLLALSREACDSPSLLVWPESAAWPFGWDESPRLRRDIAALGRAGCGLVLGSPRERGENTFNSALLVYPPHDPRNNEPAEYAKRRLVPWGEYVPAASWFPFIKGLARNAGDFTPGTDINLLPWKQQNIAMAVCYEVIFPGLVAEQARQGATVLATITNDAWYGDSSAPWQHLRAARFRAAENRRPMLRAALTGVSAIIDGRGRVQSQLGVGEQGILEARIHGSRVPSFYSRFPAWPWILSTLGAGFVMIRKLRSARTDELPRSSPT